MPCKRLQHAQYFKGNWRGVCIIFVKAEVKDWPVLSTLKTKYGNKVYFSPRDVSWGDPVQITYEEAIAILEKSLQSS